MPHSSSIHTEAAEKGTHNTLVPGPDGRLRGYNTDLSGFLTMARRAGVSFAGRKVVVLGSGGASLTVQAAVRQEGAREVAVISRQGPDNYQNLDRHQDAQVLVNATPVGMWPQLDAAPVDLDRFPDLEGVLDLIYNPLRTRLLLQAEERGIPRAGELAMLVEQAAEAEGLFFGKEIPEDRVQEILAGLWQDRANLVLVGMPGCGKTTVGRALAKLSGRALLDLDAEIARQGGRSIPEIFREEGEAAFREMESRVLAQVTADRSGWIIATGGGAVLRPENREALRRTGRVCFLRRELGELATQGRPLSQGGSLEEMYRQRLPLYQRTADFEAENRGTPEETAKTIWRDFCAYSGD